MGFPLLLTQINLRRAEGLSFIMPLMQVELSSVKVELKLREGGAKSPCRWGYCPEIYTLYILCEYQKKSKMCPPVEEGISIEV